MAIYLPLKNSHLLAIVDDDFEWLEMFPWSLASPRRGGQSVYTARCYFYPPESGNMALHRFILDAQPGDVVDHINRNCLDNRRDNLRICTLAQNSQNCKVRAHSSSGMKGVMYEKCGDGTIRRWRATVVAEGVRHRKYFPSAEEANEWAIAKRIELHGDFARHA